MVLKELQQCSSGCGMWFRVDHLQPRVDHVVVSVLFSDLGDLGQVSIVYSNHLSSNLMGLSWMQ